VRKIYRLIPIALLGLILVYVFHRYFHVHPLAVFNSKGIVAQKERNLIIFALGLSLVVVIPVFSLLATFAWKYRASNDKAKYSPELDHSRVAETIWWLIPSCLIVILSVVAWNSSHALDPYKPLNVSAKPMAIQVVALDWKWLFIYPQQNMATVNYVEFPVNTPVTFQITADAPMNSFWIPQLGGQVYAMPGMSTELHLMASQAGEYRGSSANISGVGFAGMKFVAHADSTMAFNAWVKTVKQSPNHLTSESYSQLARPSQNDPVAYYASSQANLYETTLMKFMMPMTPQSNTDSVMSGMDM